MITYETAKELKDNGFREPCEYRDNLPYPTLSELIEACGEGFWGLNRLEKDKWSCHFMEDENSTGEPLYSTPEEAVANLYLSLKRDKIINDGETPLNKESN